MKTYDVCEDHPIIQKKLDYPSILVYKPSFLRLILKTFFFVIASVHSSLGMSEGRMTERYVRANKNKNVPLLTPDQRQDFFPLSVPGERR
mgnify:CR=1 FL=1